MINRYKKNPPRSQYAYLTYDFENIKSERPFTMKTMTPLNPDNLLPMNLDQCILGKQYRVSDLISTIMTQISRYSKARDTVCDDRWYTIYDKLQTKFSERYFDQNKIERVTEEDISRHLAPVIKKMERSGKIFTQEPINLAPASKTFTIHFFLKDITKCVLAKTNDADKCGQGISAWSEELNAVYCAIFRAIEEKFVRALKETSIDANQMSEAQFDYEIKTRYDPSYPSIVNDFSQFDESQNAATQLLEDIILDLFVPKQMTELYREMRLKSKMSSPIAILINEALKNSGESATEFMNQCVARFQSMLIIKTEDVIVEGYKGDDLFINAKKIELINLLAQLIDESLKIPMKSDIDYPKHVDFCGYYMSPFGVIPDLLKYMNKFLTKDNKKLNPKEPDYPEALRLSLVDKLKFLSYDKLVYLREIYFDLYEMTDHEWYILMSTFRYFTLNKLQDQNYYGMAALYDSGIGYELEDRTEDDKNKKRIYSENVGNTVQEVGWW